MNPTPPRPRRRRPWRRTLTALGVALGVVFVGTVVTAAVWLRTDDFQRRVVPLLTAVVEQQTGERFDVERVDLRLWPPAAELRGAALTHAPTGEVIASADRVRAPLVLRGGRVAVGTLHVERPELLLHVDAEGGLRELRGRARGGRPLRELPFRRLRVTSGQLTLVFPDGRVALTELDVAPDGPLTQLRATLDLSFRDFSDRAVLAWDEITLGPDRVAVADLSLPLDALALGGQLEVGLDGALAATLSLRSELPRLDPLLGAPRALRGTLDADLAISGTTAAPAIALNALALGAELTLPAVQVPTVTYRFGDVTLAASATPDALDVEQLRVCFRGLARCVDPDSPDVVRATGRITRDLRLEDGHILAEGLSLAHLLRRMEAAPHPWTDFTGDAEITASGTLKPLRLEGPFDLAVADWRTMSGPVDDPRSPPMLVLPTATARGNLVLFQDHLELDAPTVIGPRSRGSAKVWLGFKPKGPADIRATLTHADLSDFAPLGDSELRGVGTVSGRLWGPFNALQWDGTGDVRDFSVIGIDWADHLVARIASPDMKQLQILDAQARVGQTPYTGRYVLDFRDPMSMELDLSIPPGGRGEDVLGLFIDLPGITGGLSGELHLDGPLYDLDGEARLDLVDVDLYGERFDVGRGIGAMHGGVFTLEELAVAREGGAEGISLRGSVGRAWALNLELVADGFDLETLDWLDSADLPLSGDVSVVGRIDNTLFEPAPHGRLDLRGARYADVRVPDSRVDFETAFGVTRFTGKLFGGTVATAGTLGLWGEQPYHVSAALRRFPAHLLYPVAADGGEVLAELSGDVEIDGHFGEAPSPVALRADLSSVMLQWGRHRLTQTGPWHYAQDGTRFELTGIGLQGGDTRFTLTEGRGGPEGLELRGRGTIDLDLLRLFAPGLLRSDGSAGIEVSATGRGRDVETAVDVDLAASLLRHESFPGTFEDVTGRVRLTRDGFDLTDVQASLGGGTVTGGGRITADGWIPKRWDLRARGEDVQLQWIDELPPAIGDATLSFDGPVGALLLAGRVDLREMGFVDRIDWEDWVVEYRDWVEVDYAPVDDEPWFSLDVEVVADRTVSLRNNVAEGTGSARLRFIGDTTRPGLVGDVVLDDAVFFLQDREFAVERGLVAFRDPWTWDPQLDFDLSTEIRSRDTRYRVNYLVRGPFSDWRTETRSDPPLAQADINALLWFGATADELEELGELPQALAQGVADFILTDLFINQGRGVRDELRVFDRVELVTGVDSRGDYTPDPRILVEKRYADASNLTVTGELNPVNIDRQLVRGSVDLTDGWALSAWYASRQRDRVLTIGGAYGVDVRARWEAD